MNILQLIRKQNFKIASIGLILFGISCNFNPKGNKEMDDISTHSIEVQGHRGDRGNFPENTIPAFKSAVKKGVDVIELDVIISKDNKVVVSHEPYISSKYMLSPSGDTINKKRERSYNLYEMTYDSIRKFDAGSKENPSFPEQTRIKTYKPLLSEVIDTVEAFITKEGLKPVRYNVELKSSEDQYGIYQPHPQEFVQLVMQLLEEKQVEEKVNIQSFDVNILNVLNENYPEVEVAYLVSSEEIAQNLSLLNFKPEIYSPSYSLVKDTAFVDSIKSRGMRLIPWTVNEKEAIKKMIELKVDGIITDYPERVLAEL